MKTKLLFIAAIVMGVLTTVLFFDYMKKFDEVSAANETLTPVVVAKQEIRRNQKIEPGMIEIKQVPKMSLHPGAVTTLSAAAGSFAEADIAAGETLLGHRLKSMKDEAQFVSKKVRDGYRAVSIGSNMVQSVSNLLEPGDEVDVIASKEQEKGRFVSVLQLQKVRVLAVGRRLVETDADHPYAEYSSVTLEVKQQEAVDLVNAALEGPVHLMANTRIVEGGAESKTGK